MEKFVVHTGGNRFYPHVKVFAGGEVSVTLPNTWPDYPVTPNDTVLIKARLKNSEDVMALLMLTDAIRQTKSFLPCDIALHMSYLSYARQDRVCNPGEALAIKVFCDLINSQGYSRVVVFDAHSDVGPALLDKCVNLEALHVLNRCDSLDTTLRKTVVSLVSPDAGANKKVLAISKYYGGLPVIRADKSRDLKTGEITGTEVYCDDLKGKHCLVIDDICDAGRTFIELAKALKAKGAGMLTLYITHGIFSYGAVEKLYNAGFTRIYTTDSFCDISDHKENADFLTVIKL